VNLHGRLGDIDLSGYDFVGIALEGDVFEDIPEAVIMKAALIAASGLIGQIA
jgi:hypothetical protein